MSKTTRIPGLVLTDHTFVVPVDHSKPEGDEITVFAREVSAPGKDKDDLPWMLFLQGGPGFPSPRPESRSGWLKRALQDYRVLLLDQRGTGLSTPINYQTLARLSSPAAQADYLKNFRADAIVQDAEIIRKELVGNDKPWRVLGQSFGGFCLAHYLSAAPEGVEAAIFTGGLPPIGHSIDDIYRATYRRVIDQNRNYFKRYPGDQKQVSDVVKYLNMHRVELADGGVLTAHRFLQLGMVFGFQNGFETVHYLLEGAFVEGQKGLELNYSFLKGIQNMQPYDSNPIYAILHEPIYCEGYASKWSAERIRAEF
jgi:pimeloyl-ACP methyl ester carboxylesterase